MPDQPENSEGLEAMCFCARLDLCTSKNMFFVVIYASKGVEEKEKGEQGRGRERRGKIGV